MNRDVFEGLKNLFMLDLRDNSCINSEAIKNGLETLRQTVDIRCKFDEQKLIASVGECGKVKEVLIKPLMAHGEVAQPGQWPFLVALKKKTHHTFFCGGNLITSQHVLTGKNDESWKHFDDFHFFLSAAHCIQSKNDSNKAEPNSIIVHLGETQIQHRKKDEVIRNVADIFVHHDWKISEQKFDADLAVLLLEKPVAFTNFIQPVCLPEPSTANEIVPGFTVSQ